MDKRPNASVRGINPDLFHKVKVDAVRKGKTLVAWWEEAAQEKLKR